MKAYVKPKTPSEKSIEIENSDEPAKSVKHSSIKSIDLSQEEKIADAKISEKSIKEIAAAS